MSIVVWKLQRRAFSRELKPYKRSSKDDLSQLLHLNLYSYKLQELKRFNPRSRIVFDLSLQARWAGFHFSGWLTASRAKVSIIFVSEACLVVVTVLLVLLIMALEPLLNFKSQFGESFSAENPHGNS